VRKKTNFEDAARRGAKETIKSGGNRKRFWSRNTLTRCRRKGKKYSDTARGGGQTLPGVSLEVTMLPTIEGRKSTQSQKPTLVLVTKNLLGAVFIKYEGSHRSFKKKNSYENARLHLLGGGKIRQPSASWGKRYIGKVSCAGQE